MRRARKVLLWIVLGTMACLAFGVMMPVTSKGSLLIAHVTAARSSINEYRARNGSWPESWSELNRPMPKDLVNIELTRLSSSKESAEYRISITRKQLWLRQRHASRRFKVSLRSP